MSANGTCGLPITISEGVVSKSSGAVTINYGLLSNNTATGGATFTANNSVDLGNNTRWTINASSPNASVHFFYSLD